MTTATIIGLSTPEGAYLARLLRARHYRVFGSAADPAQARAMLAALGADEVVIGEAAAPDEVYLLDADVGLDAALARWPGARILTTLTGEDVAGARAAGRYAVAALMYGHVSRLDGPAHPVLATCAAVRDGRPFDDDDSPRDLGWTPEYVDALWRMLQAAEPADHVIASGVGLSLRDIAGHAAEYFKVRLTLPPAGTDRGDLGDTRGAAEGLGWRAFTSGRELVRALCEGLPA